MTIMILRAVTIKVTLASFFFPSVKHNITELTSTLHLQYNLGSSLKKVESTGQIPKNDPKSALIEKN